MTRKSAGLSVAVVLVVCVAIFVVFQIAQNASPEYKATEREAVQEYSKDGHQVRSADCTPHIKSYGYPGDYDYRCTLHYADGTSAVARIHDHTFNAGTADNPDNENDWTFYPPRS
jgi:hypothetical protein